MDQQPSKVYANTFEIEVSLYDFCLKFGIRDRIQGEKGDRDDIANIFISPTHAKAIAHVLNNAIEQYEQKFGEIWFDPSILNPDNKG